MFQNVSTLHYGNQTSLIIIILQERGEYFRLNVIVPNAFSYIPYQNIRISYIMTKLLRWKGYHGLIYLYMPYNQNGTLKVFPPLAYRYMAWLMDYLVSVNYA